MKGNCKRYIVEFYRDSDLVKVVRVKRQSKIRCADERYSGYYYGVDVKITEDTTTHKLWAEMEFFDGKLKEKAATVIHHGHAAKSWRGKYDHEFIVVIRPDCDEVETSKSYAVELYKNSQRVDVRTPDENGMAKCTCESENGYSYGVEVKINENHKPEYEGKHMGWADVKFFAGHLCSPHKIVGLSKGYALAYWSSSFNFDIGVVIRLVDA